MKSPLELHDFVLSSNWDDGQARLRAVLDHPLCDLGTATLIHWLSQPYLTLAKEAAGTVEGRDNVEIAFIKNMQARLVAQDFARGQIRFDPRNFMGNDDTRPEAGSNGMPLIPPKLMAATPGRPLDYLRL